MTKAAKSKDTIYEMVTERIVAMLEEGTAPWRKPWTPASFPRNISGHRYRGVNLFLLQSQYDSPFWLTYKQAQERGGNVIKGEQSTMIIFWKRLRITEVNEATGKREPKVIPMLRYFRVFNLEQTENVKLPKSVIEFDASKVEHAPITDAEAIVKGYKGGPPIKVTESDQAFYLPGLDHITVPQMSQYPSPDEYYSTLFHEMGHSTGHPDRLNRDQKGNFGSHDYGREELVAEMTAAFLCSEAGITMTMDNSAAYLASWIKTIKEDVRAVVVAGGQAQRAADHILGRTYEDKPETDKDAAPAAQEKKELAA